MKRKSPYGRIVESYVWLLLLLLPVNAQPLALQLDLSGDWRLQAADNPDFAKPDFDDSAWQTMRLPRTELWPRGYRWLRRSITLPEQANTSQLALSVGSIAEVYEVYINGTRIASVGAPRLSATYIVRPRTFAVPPGLIPPGTRNLTIALRLWHSGFIGEAVRSLRGFPDSGPYLLTNRSNAPLHVEVAAMSQRERAASPRLAVGVFDLVLGILLLLGWMIHKERTDLVWFAAFLFSESLLRLCGYVSLIADWPHSSNAPVETFLNFSCFFLAYFLLRALGRRLLWFQVLAWAALLSELTYSAHLLWFDDVRYDRWGIALVCSLASNVLVAAWLLWSVRRNEWRAYAIPAAVFCIAFLQSQRFPRGRFYPVFLAYGMTWQLYDILIMVLGLSITALLIRSLGAARERLAGEMAAARAVQQLLLADVPSQAGSPYRIDTFYEPAQEVGGDFYKVLDCADGSRVVVAGDVSGKGLPAAMLVSAVIGALRRETSSSPAAILAALNQAVTGQTGGGFVTCCAVRLEPGGQTTIANAGHIAPCIDGREVEVESGLPLGIVDEVDYVETVVDLQPGVALTLVSDGVIEAANSRGELFGFERSRAISRQSPQEIAHAAKAWGQNDDITVVTVRRTV